MLALASTLGSGEQELSALFAPDLAAALVAADGGDTTGKTYPVCHPKIFTSREMARAVGRPTLLDSAKADELLAPAWTGDPTAFTRDSGWQATHDLETGLRATVAWYREQGWLPG